MKIFIINTDYNEFLSELYRTTPDLGFHSFAAQQQVRMESLFGGAGFYAQALRRLGHQAEEIFVNNYPMQCAWMREHGLKIPNESESSWQIIRRGGWLPWPVRRTSAPWKYEILLEQVRREKPDVILNQAMDTLDSDFLKDLRSLVKVLAGQHAAMPLKADQNLANYDLCISSFPPTVDWFRRQGLNACWQPLSFEPAILDYLAPAQTQTYSITFIGSLYPVHASRREMLEYLARYIPLDIWGPPAIAEIPALREFYRGVAYGRKMFEILAHSKITLNHHGSIPPFANNFRLFEATGVGTCLATDWKENLKDLFDPDREVISYRTNQECLEKIQHFLTHEAERRQIADAGHQRTLAQHTHEQRMAEFVEMVRKLM